MHWAPQNKCFGPKISITPSSSINSGRTNFKSASRELVQDIPGFRNLSTKKVTFCRRPAVAPRTTRKRRESMPVLTGARIHAAAAHPTPPETSKDQRSMQLKLESRRYPSTLLGACLGLGPEQKLQLLVESSDFP